MSDNAVFDYHAPPIIPVILSGGAGTRLWPMSTEQHPKQFLALTGDESLFSLTLQRVRNHNLFAPPFIIGSGDHAALIEAEILGEEWSDAHIILEPARRNTAPAIALAAHAISRQYGADAVMLVMPSDHIIQKPDVFHKAVEVMLPHAQKGWLATFGIAPDRPETGYGYIAMGEMLDDRVAKVKQFVEKPDKPNAQNMLDAGGFNWNAGIFMMRCDSLLAEMAEYHPDIVHHTQISMMQARDEGRLCFADKGSFERCDSIAIDYAVMEKSDKIVTMALDCGWSDIGSWDMLAEFMDHDENGNAVQGHGLVLDGKNCLIESEGVHVTIKNCDDLIVVASRHHVIILPRGDSQQVRDIVAAVKEQEEAEKQARKAKQNL